MTGTPAGPGSPPVAGSDDPATGGRGVARFLTPAWAESYNEALAGVTLPSPGPGAGLAAADGRFAMAQEVHGTPDGDVRLLVVAEDGALRFRVEPLGGQAGGDEMAAASPEVTIVVSYADAVAMSTGELTPADALNGGRIRVRGDLSVLMAGLAMMDAARALLDGPTAATTY